MTERLDFKGGKYTIINDNGHLSALRYGEPWIYEISGSKLFYAMFVEALRLKDVCDALRAEIDNIKEVEFPRKAQAVADGWRAKCERLEAELAALKKQKPVAVVVSADEYGPCLEWKKHWLDFIGATLYALPGTQGEVK